MERKGNKNLVIKMNEINLESEWDTFSSDTSRDLRLLPTTRNSSSSSTIFL